jgi:hypothetical protein
LVQGFWFFCGMEYLSSVTLQMTEYGKLPRELVGAIMGQKE